MPFRSGKTYGHELGLSCCFRQWKAESHCNKLHGYALAVELEFEGRELDKTNWIVDFGGLKDIKAWIQDHFDHKTVVAEDDPDLAVFKMMESRGVCDLVVVPRVGCEAFAQMIGFHVDAWVKAKYRGRVWLHRVTVREHGANHASWMPL